MFLFPYPLYNSPSQRFRFEQYFEELTKQGIQYTCHSFWDKKGWDILYAKGKYIDKLIFLLFGFFHRFNTIINVRKTDLVFIHRECAPLGPPVFEWIIAKVLKKRIIYDFDDAIWLPNTSSENKLASFIKWHGKFNAICRWSYRISCGNAYLASVARGFNPNVVINPTTIDTEHLHNPALYDVKKDENFITIGWTGTHSTMKYLDEVIPVLRTLEERYSNLRFLVICNKKPHFNLRSLTFIPWSKETEIPDLLKIDIGIMPLVNDAWAFGKCGFKVLQYMALAIPAVASPIGVNAAIIDQGKNGFSCTTNEEWLACLEHLIQQAELRRSIGIQGRKKVVEGFSVASNSANFLGLFEI